MDEANLKKRELRQAAQKQFEALGNEQYELKSQAIAERLFDFANFQESQTILLYASLPTEPESRRILEECFSLGKVVLLPVTHPKTFELLSFRLEKPGNSLRRGVTGRQEPDPRFCKFVPLDFVDLAIIPGLVFDERGGRIGYGTGCYDRLIPELPPTTRKVALAMEHQLVSQVPMESHDRFVDILITEDRVIYKI
jgi:5-formyltetrahydrofolate cyclo-ligase